MIFVFRDLLTATQRSFSCLIEGFTSAFDGLDRMAQITDSVICAKLSSSLVNCCHLLQVLFCGIRSENVIDGTEVGVLGNCLRKLLKL